MKRLLAMSLFLIGCHKDPGRSGGSIGIIAPSAPISSHETWVAFGQSNMSGDGQNPLFPDSPAIQTINPESSNRKGIGYAFALARNEQGVSVTLVQCSVGGMTIEHFERGGDLYERCLNILAQNNITNITGVLFDQGASDAMANHPTEWSYKFVTMVYGFRAHFHNDILPIIFGRTNPAPQGYVAPYTDDIRGQQTTIGLTNVVMVDTDNLPRLEGGWHFTTQGHYEAGKRFERAYRFIGDR